MDIPVDIPPCCGHLHVQAVEHHRPQQSFAVPGQVGQQQAKPKRRRRSAAELQALRAESAISVTVDGTQFDGQADHIARLLNAMRHAA